MRRRATLALGTAVLLAAAACGGTPKGRDGTSAGFADCEPHPNTCNTAPTRKGGTFVVTIEKTLPNWNTFDGDGSSFETAQVVAGVTAIPFVFEPDSSVRWSRQLFAAEPQVLTGGSAPMTVLLKIRPEAVWSDGTPIGARDFQYFWRSNNGRDCPNCTSAATAGYDSISAVTGSDNDKTVTLTFSKPYPDWRSLFGNLYPAHVAAQAGDLATPAGLKAAFDRFKADVPKWSGGPYRITEYIQDQSVTLVPNERWYGTPKPSLDKVVFRIISDQAQQLPALRNKEVHALTSQPNADMVTSVAKVPGVNYSLAKGPSWEHADLNLANAFLADLPLRQAIFTAVDRKAIIDKTVGSFFTGAAPLNSHNFMPGAPGYQDLITGTGQGSGDIARARKILTDAGYRLDGGKLSTKDGRPVPALRLRYTSGNQLRQQTGELIQNQLRQLGIEVTIVPTDALSNTLSTGDFDIIVYAWIGTPFLADKKDLWTTGAGSNYGRYSNATVDDLINRAVVELDEAKARDLFNQADEIMTREAYNLPLFQKPVFLAVYGDYVNIRNNPTSAGPAYNMEEWGLKT